MLCDRNISLSMQLNFTILFLVIYTNYLYGGKKSQKIFYVSSVFNLHFLESNIIIKCVLRSCEVLDLKSCWKILRFKSNHKIIKAVGFITVVVL